MRRNEIRRASDSDPREFTKKEKPKIKSRWSKALARLAVLGISMMPPGNTTESGPHIEEGAHEMVQDSEDVAENQGAAKEMMLEKEKLIEQEEEQVSLEEIQAEVLDELVGEIERLVINNLDAGWRVSQDQKDRFETMTVVQGEPGHVLIEMEGQPIIDVVMTTYDEYQQYLENLVQAASLESDVEGRIAEELVKTSQKRDADKGYNDLDPNAPFYYIESSTDVQSSEVHGGSLIDDNDRTWLVRNVLSLAGMNAKH